MKHTTAIILLVALGACTSPREGCVNDALDEVRDLQERIETVEGNIERGYAIHVSRAPRTSVGFCTGSGRGNIGISTCVGGNNGPREQPVAIDVDAEREKLERLRGRLNEVQIALQGKVDQCDIYPDGSESAP